jgi:hypothetical protein
VAGLARVAEKVLPVTRKEITRDDLELFAQVANVIPWVMREEFGDGSK